MALHVKATYRLTYFKIHPSVNITNQDVLGEHFPVLKKEVKDLFTTVY